MSNLKEIKRRIKTIENIEHVTDAIQKIAATRLFKLKNRMIALRNYTNAQLELIYNVADAIFPIKSNPSGIDLLFIITSDKGLCGGFNTRVLEKAAEFLKNSSNTKIIVAGKKGLHNFEKGKIEILHKLVNIPAFLTLKFIDEAVNLVLSNINEKKIKSVNLLFTEFKSASNLNPVVRQIFPLTYSQEFIFKRPFYIYEPNEEKIIMDLFPKYIGAQILLAFEESVTAEHTARMMMMERATKSADDMIIELTMQRNKNRQATITRELSEIVGTTSALENT